MPLKDIEYKVNKKGARKAIVFYLGMSLAFFVFYLVVPSQIGEGVGLSSVLEDVARIAGIAGTIGFGVLGLLFLRRLRSKKPYLVISVDGIHDNASGISSGAGLIEWGEIDDIRLSAYQGLPCVELVPKNRERFLQRFSRMERFNRSMRLGYPAVAIRGPLLPVEPEVLVEQMQEYRKFAHDAACRRVP